MTAFLAWMVYPEAASAEPIHGWGGLAAVGSFIGRRTELAEITERLRSARLVTLTGAAGVGKTQLAVRVAEQARDGFPDGVWLVEAASLHEGGLLADTLAMSLDLPSRSPRGPLVDLAEFLRGKKLLVVLDNCEHIVDACAEVVSTLLSNVPDLRVLATSRQALRISGEHLWSVAPLPTPEAIAVAPVAEYPAVTLFAERASAVVPGFRVTLNNWDTVAGICRQLEGLPLAIELAAGRLSSMSLDQLLRGLRDRYQLLGTDSGAVAGRHRSLRAAIDWSYELCSPAEQLLWQRVSLFAGSFDLDTAEQLCAGDGLEAELIFDLVVALLDKSILHREAAPGHVSYRLLETLREYGLDRLRRAGQLVSWQRRHRDHYLRLVERNAVEWFGPHQVKSLYQIRTEQPEIRSALEFSLSRADETPIGQSMAATLWLYWIGCGLLSEGRYWLDRALRLGQAVTPQRAKALWVNAWIAALQGESQRATAMAEQCRRDAQRLDDARVLAYATQALGVTALVSDDLPAAVSLLLEARRLLSHELTTHPRDSQLLSVQAITGVQLAAALTFQGHAEQAIPLCEECHVWCDQHGERWVLSYALFVLGLAEWESGRPAEAAEHARECLRIKHAFYDLLGMALSVDLLAWVAAADGAYDRASMLLGGADRMWSLFGLPLFGSQVWTTPRRASEALCRRALGDHEFEARLRGGHDLPTGELVAWALA